MKKQLCALLSGFICIMSFFSCGETANNYPAESEMTAENDVMSDDTEEIVYLLPELDYGGRKFTILTGYDIEYMIHAEEQDGEIINDQMYLTERSVEEEYNVEIVTTVTSEDSCGIVKGKILPMVMAGDNSYNVAYANSVYLAEAQTSGIYKNLCDISQ